jgi:capsular polysaccharide export protein
MSGLRRPFTLTVGLPAIRTRRLGWGSKVISSAASIVLPDKDKSDGTDSPPTPGEQLQFLRIPPFPGSSTEHFTPLEGTSFDGEQLREMLIRHRVGGAYWAACPDVPHSRIVVRVRDALVAAHSLANGAPIVLWVDHGPAVASVQTVVGESDPWHMLDGASALIAHKADEVALVAALLGVPVYFPENGDVGAAKLDVLAMLKDAVPAGQYRNPFTGEPIGLAALVELCGFWRDLVRSNRGIAGGFGFAFWKQDRIAPLLWNGYAPFRFLTRAAAVAPKQPVAVWRAKTQPAVIQALAKNGSPLIEVEDGFLRSRGLGADCIPPLSIVLDRLGPHFDPAHPSELELLIERGEFSETLLERARDLRRVIVAAGLGKYGHGGKALGRPAGQRRHILVPGQVEDDRAVQTGGCGLTSNLELLKRVRNEASDAYIIYKPHPDVVAGHRRGSIPDRYCRRYADQIADDLAIDPLLAMVDEVHVNTSLAGFEALLREKAVTTHGVPFYAGWGLTRDLGPVPGRRTAQRSLDELVAATLLQYPRYLDPVTGLPCPAEVVVARLCQAEACDPGLLVGVRRMQGKLMRRLRSLVQ